MHISNYQCACFLQIHPQKSIVQPSNQQLWQDIDLCHIEIVEEHVVQAIKRKLVTTRKYKKEQREELILII